MSQKQLGIVFGVIIAVLLAIVVYLVWQNQTPTEQLDRQTTTPIDTLEPENNPPAITPPQTQQPTPPASNPLVYNNSEYGFEVTFPEYFRGYQVIKSPEANNSYYICRPTKTTGWTDCPNGFWRHTIITVYGVNEWNKMVSDMKLNDPDFDPETWAGSALWPDKKMAQNDKYVVGYSFSFQDGANDVINPDPAVSFNDVVKTFRWTR